MFEKKYSSNKYVFYSLAVVSILIISFVFALLKMDDYRYVKHPIYFSTSVNGLRKGSQVFYKGVHIGIVEDIKVMLPEVKTIKVIVKIEKEMLIYEGFVASLGYQGITGYSIIDLTNKGKSQEILKYGEEIKSEPSVIDNLYLFIPNLMDDCSKIIKKFDNILSDKDDIFYDGLKNFKNSMAQLEILLKKAENNSEELQKALPALQKTFEDISSLINSLKNDKEEFKKEHFHLLIDILNDISKTAKMASKNKLNLAKVF